MSLLKVVAQVGVPSKEMLIVGLVNFAKCELSIAKKRRKRLAEICLVESLITSTSAVRGALWRVSIVSARALWRVSVVSACALWRVTIASLL